LYCPLDRIPSEVVRVDEVPDRDNDRTPFIARSRMSLFVFTSPPQVPSSSPLAGSTIPRLGVYVLGIENPHAAIGVHPGLWAGWIGVHVFIAVGTIPVHAGLDIGVIGAHGTV
jgi:hypothetical protein